MILNCVQKTADFIPIVKTPRFWQSEKTLKFGDDVEIDDLTGHQLLATYPNCFVVKQFGDAPKKAEVKRGRPKLEVETKVLESYDSKVEGETGTIEASM